MTARPGVPPFALPGSRAYLLDDGTLVTRESLRAVFVAAARAGVPARELDAALRRALDLDVPPVDLSCDENLEKLRENVGYRDNPRRSERVSAEEVLRRALANKPLAPAFPGVLSWWRVLVDALLLR